MILACQVPLPDDHDDEELKENDEITVIESTSSVDSHIGHKVMNYVLNRTKAVRKKLKWNGDDAIDIAMKDSNKCGILTFHSTEVFERVRENITMRYWKKELTTASTSQSVDWIEHSDHSGLVVQDSITLFEDKCKLAKVSIYRTKNKIMVQGTHVLQWLCHEFVHILQGVSKKVVVLDFHRQSIPENVGHGGVVLYDESNNDLAAWDDDLDAEDTLTALGPPPCTDHVTHDSAQDVPAVAVKSTAPKAKRLSRVRGSLAGVKTSTPNPKTQSAIGLLQMQLALRTLEATVRSVQESVVDRQTDTRTLVEDAKKQSTNTMKALVQSLSGRVETLEQERGIMLSRIQDIETANAKLRGKVLSLEHKLKNANQAASVSQVHEKTMHTDAMSEASVVVSDSVSTPSGAPVETCPRQSPSTSAQLESDPVIDRALEYTVPVSNAYDALQQDPDDSSANLIKPTGGLPSVEPRTDNEREFSLKLPSVCAHAILGSSMVKDIRPRAMDPSGKTQVRSLRGAKINDLKRAVDKIPSLPNCQIVSLLIGSNDICNKDAPPTSNLISEYEGLLKSVSNRFPNAMIRVCSVLRRKGKLGSLYNSHIADFNVDLPYLCSKTNSRFLNIQSYFFQHNGAVKSYLYTDLTHVNMKGAAMLANLLRIGSSAKKHNSTHQKPSINVSTHSGGLEIEQSNMSVQRAGPETNESPQQSVDSSTRQCQAPMGIPATTTTGHHAGPLMGHTSGTHSAPFPAFGSPAMWHPGVHVPTMNAFHQWQPQAPMNYLQYGPQSYMPPVPQLSFHGGPVPGGPMIAPMVH
jgi:hypothetical protein